MNHSSIFIAGPVTMAHLQDLIDKENKNLRSGAFTFFMGQVRNDKLEDKEVTAIDYTAYEELAEKIAERIKNETMEKYGLHSISIVHSLGTVKAGEASLLVLVTAGHRPKIFEACSFIVEEIKRDLPVWGKEVLEDNTYQWKKNNFHHG
jgi:molybdopterin synthase catalytic subunit